MRAPKTNVSLGQMSYNLPEDMDRLRWSIKKIVDNLDNCASKLSSLFID